MKQYLYFRHPQRGWTVAKTAKDNPLTEDDKKAFGALGNVDVDEGFSVYGYAQKNGAIYLVQKTNSQKLGVLVHGLTDKIGEFDGYAIDYLHGLDSDIEERFAREDPDPVPPRVAPKCSPYFEVIDFSYVPAIVDAIMRGDRPVIIRGENKCAVDAFAKTVLHALPQSLANGVGYIMCYDDIPNMILSADAALSFRLVGTTSKRWGYDNRCYVYNMDTHAFDYAPAQLSSYAEGLSEIATICDERFVSEYADCAEQTASGGDYETEKVKFALARKRFAFNPTPNGAESLLRGSAETGVGISEKELRDCVKIILASPIDIEKEKSIRQVATRLGNVKDLFDEFTLQGIIDKRYGNSPDYESLCGAKFCEHMTPEDFRTWLDRLISRPSAYALGFLRNVMRSSVSSAFVTAARNVIAEMLSADCLMYAESRVDFSIAECIKDKKLGATDKIELAALALVYAFETESDSEVNKFYGRRRREVYSTLVSLAREKTNGTPTASELSAAVLDIWLDTATALTAYGEFDFTSMAENYRDDVSRLTFEQSIDFYLDERCRRTESALRDCIFLDKILACNTSADITPENCDKVQTVIDATSPSVIEREKEKVDVILRRIKGISSLAGAESDLYEFRRAFVESGAERLNKGIREKIKKEYSRHDDQSDERERETARARKVGRAWISESHHGEDYTVKMVSASYCIYTLLIALGFLLVSVFLVYLPVIARAGALGDFGYINDYLPSYVRLWHVLTPPIIYAAFYAVYFVMLLVTKNAKKKSLLRAVIAVAVCLLLPQILWDATYMIVYFFGAL